MRRHLAAVPTVVLSVAIVMPPPAGAQTYEELRVIAWSRGEDAVALRGRQDVYTDDGQHFFSITILIVSAVDLAVVKTFAIDVSSPATRRATWETAEDWLTSEGYMFVAGANARVLEHEFGPVGDVTLPHAIPEVTKRESGNWFGDHPLRIPLAADFFPADVTAAHLELAWERVRGTADGRYVYFERSERRVVPPGEEHNAQVLTLVAWRNDATDPTIRAVASVAYVEEPTLPVHQQPLEDVAGQVPYACSYEYSPSRRWLVLVCYHAGMMASRFGDYQIISLEAVGDTLRTPR